MNNYILITDTGCDILPEKLNEWNVKYLELIFRFDDEDKEYHEFDMDKKEFFQQMRNGRVTRTAGLNYATYRDAFESELKAGKDVLYIGFSSGLSSTTSKLATMVAGELQEEYPDRKMIVVDSLGASAGHGLLVYHAYKQREQGASIEENAQYLKALVPNLCFWFTVDDLVYLKRGGRVSGAAALAATVLNIKPVLHMDLEGHMVGVSKVKGRKKALKAIAQKYIDTLRDEENTEYFISHADCLDDALLIEKYIYEATGRKASLITWIGTVVGSHAGPGAISIFFVGTER